jgi:hypothetical protein
LPSSSSSSSSTTSSSSLQSNLIHRNIDGSKADIQLVHDQLVVEEEKCDWEGPLKDAEEHYLSCRFSYMQCTHEGCTYILQQKDFSEHSFRCLFRPLKCIYCHQKGIRQRDLERHLEVCPDRWVPCPRGCSDAKGKVKVMKRLLEEHKAVCALEIVACPFSDMGCNLRLTRKEMLVHSNDASAHLKGKRGSLCVWILCVCRMPLQ